MSIPTLLALGGAACMAYAIFIPYRSAAPLAAPELVDAPPAEVPALAPEPPVAGPQGLVPAWPRLVEANAPACNASARLDLVDALAALQTPWALAVLRQADGDESDPVVAAAIAAALSSTQSLVT